jgi:class 3 adenylate cyclase/tetratricopeptide (TPR) repeat protein
MERKLAAVLFVDLVDSTSLVAGTDPEIVRRRVREFFDRVSHCVTTHGGIVEKFAGDAVMAAFGVPQAHEDDAERAVRAAFGILEATTELGLEARVGVEAGEVVVEDGDSTFATGEAVNVAARLQQRAEPGHVLIGPGAHRLTLGRIEAEDLGPVEVRGLAGPIWAWRALSTTNGARSTFAAEAPLVGRSAELELLENTFQRAHRDRRAHLFTMFGEAGIGKTRLAREFVENLEGTTVLVGRCLPYGESVTYWALAEIVKSAAGIDDDDPLDEAIEKLRVCCEDEAIADLLGLASGVLEAVHGERSAQEIAWAARAWVERMAQEQPLVLAFEDIHWAEEPLLELIEHLATWVRAAPLLILCLARPELLDIHPGWGGGRVRATAIELEPLLREESAELVDALLASTPLAADCREEVLDLTEGNPLFVEETIRMLAEADGVLKLGTPTTLQALIAARIDRLPPPAKTVLQRAAVVGRIFWGGAIEHLSPEVDDVEPALQDLLLRDLILPESRSTISGETAYRFKHVLIREVAYGGLPKFARAEHHARFAEWLSERAGAELLEIRANHLDRAAALRAELDGAPPPELASAAAGALYKAGKRALAREANQQARKLLLRAVELEPTLERRYAAAKAAVRLSDLPAVWQEMEKVRAEAAAAENREIEGRALTALAETAVLRQGDVERAREFSDRALELVADDPPALFDALAARSPIVWTSGDLEEYERVVRKTLELAQRLERKDLEAEATAQVAHSLLARLDLDQAERVLEDALALADESGSLVARGVALRHRGLLHLERRELDEAERDLEDSRAVLSEVGAAWSVGRALNYSAWAAWWKGDPGRAERLFRESIKILKPLEDRATLCESQRGLAQLLAEEGRIDEAERYALQGQETVGPHDRTSLATTAMALAVVRAAQGRDDQAEELFRTALAEIEPTGFKRNEREVLTTFAQFLRDRGRDDEAAAVEERRSMLVAPAAA